MSAMTTITLETPVEGLAATAPQSLSFAPSTHVRAFLLRRELGDVLVYANDKADRDASWPSASTSATGTRPWWPAATAGCRCSCTRPTARRSSP